ncbi:MAG: base excision DNA repair protein [Silvibacterium sp.]|nr:base excision DNA repair protein [Silvibacterium sp.]
MREVSPQKPSLKAQFAATGAGLRLRAIYDRLLSTYGPQQWWPAKTPLEVVVGAYLTQNTAWTSVERSLGNLETHGLLTVDGLRNVSEKELRDHIRPSGYMIRKAAAIKAFVAFLDRFYEGSLGKLSEESPAIARERLLALPAVGPETADAILLYALGQPAMVVDEYLRRVTTRHGLLPASSKYAEIQVLAESAFEHDPPGIRAQHYNEFHAVVVQVGKRHCRRVPKCEECPLAFDLPKPLAPAPIIAKSRRIESA